MASFITVTGGGTFTYAGTIYRTGTTPVDDSDFEALEEAAAEVDWVHMTRLEGVAVVKAPEPDPPADPKPEAKGKGKPSKGSKKSKKAEPLSPEEIEKTSTTKTEQE